MGKYENSVKIAAKLPISNSFCHFKIIKKDDEIKKFPVSVTGKIGIKISSDNAQENLMELSQIEDGKGGNDYAGIVFYSDMPLTPNGNVLVCLDVDTKRCKLAPAIVGDVVAWARNNGFLYEKSYSGKGCHIFVAVKPGTRLPNKVDLGGGAEIEIFHSDFIKCLMLTGENLSGEFIDEPINLVQEFAKIGININAPQKEAEEVEETKTVNQTTGEITGGVLRAADVNQSAMQNLSKWVEQLFPQAMSRDSEGWRVTPESLGRKLEEHISIHPTGIVDFGVHDMGDPRQGKRTAIELVAEHQFGSINEWQKATDWLRDRLGVAAFTATRKDIPLPKSLDSSELSIVHMDLDISGVPTEKDGSIKPTYINTINAVSQLPLFFDEFKNTGVIKDGDQSRPFSDDDYVEVCHLLERFGFRTPPVNIVKPVIRAAINKNKFDSAIDWAKGLRWDGKKRCESLFSTYFGVEQSDYERSVSHYITTAMAGRLLAPGCQADMVPILVGGQGIGKTRTVKALAPNIEVFAEIDLASSKNDDLSRQLRGKLIGELAELKGLKTKDMEWIKAWITRTHEEWTPKYFEFSTTMARRCVFIGTTNESQFLADQTGNRRWLPMDSVRACDPDAMAKDCEQIWAEAIELFNANGVMWEEAKNLGEGQHDQYMVRDEVLIERLGVWLKAQVNANKKYHTLADVMKGLDYPSNPARKDQYAVGNAMRFYGYENKTTREPGNPIKFKAWHKNEVEK